MPGVGALHVRLMCETGLWAENLRMAEVSFATYLEHDIYVQEHQMHRLSSPCNRRPNTWTSHQQGNWTRSASAVGFRTPEPMF